MYIGQSQDLRYPTEVTLNFIDVVEPGSVTVL